MQFARNRLLYSPTGFTSVIALGAIIEAALPLLLAHVCLGRRDAPNGEGSPV